MHHECLKQRLPAFDGNFVSHQVESELTEDVPCGPLTFITRTEHWRIGRGNSTGY